MIILPENGFGNNSLLRGLVGAWCPSAGPTGNVLRDLSGYRNNGVLTNMDASSDWVIDGGKYALDFDGVNDYVTFGNMPVINQAINITVSVWLYTRSTANFELGKYRSNQRGFLIFGAAATGFSFDGRDPNYISSGPSGAINLNQWYHVVGRKNGTVWSISVDGVQKSSTTSGTGTVALDNSNPFEIGRLLVDANAVGYQNGLISDVGLWNRALKK
jgi:hypothetical protein